MSFFFTRLFSWLCGQNPSHLWTPGGMPLPCCQRCTGLYAGALAALALLAWIRPRVSRGFLAVHALFLLQMIPCGLYWVPQSPLLRALSGILGGFGMVAFLWVAPASRWLDGISNRWGGNWTYGFGLALTMGAIPWLAMGNQTAGVALSWLVFEGALGLAGLVVANIRTVAKCR